ncbi:hypothetical protein Aph02nite_48440 [Actinoplanes philippinensis]|uniref:Uncharacterized conserved protein YndB, AHSA1/START domain n=1 Tax=Actinoplanes philippinensis TaxID=35752 RepID=A0A1I2HYF4_9ACTN|nr:SRPBCC domain-containing protein [Actinoplanes philippinensis]GIE78894.1 hypothetical protein Aph02nite_48440 [Actinoplanes philippinensis]SFF34473.1 Uncharacterized conserved protein YndB, AHSA1/START domain [Actinoplanes philippinensis]
MSEFTIVNEYPRPRPVVWQALTDPALVPLWTSTGQGGRPEGFEPVAGTRFRFVGKPVPGWDGIVRCEVLTADRPALLRFTWRNKETDTPSLVTCRLDETATGTRLTYQHTGFRGIEGFVMSRLLARVRRTMLSKGLPTLLDDLDDQGRLRPGSRLRPQP